MTPTEHDQARGRATAAGLAKLTDAQLVEFAKTADAMDALVKRLPKDFSGADEMALVFRLKPRTPVGGRP